MSNLEQHYVDGYNTFIEKVAGGFSKEEHQANLEKSNILEPAVAGTIGAGFGAFVGNSEKFLDGKKVKFKSKPALIGAAAMTALGAGLDQYSKSHSRKVLEKYKK